MFHLCKLAFIYVNGDLHLRQVEKESITANLSGLGRVQCQTPGLIFWGAEAGCGDSTILRRQFGT